MNRTTKIALIAGAAFGMTASAQTNLDTDRAYAAELLADAGARASLLQSGNAGHDGKHFFLASGDGNYRLNVSGAIQFRYNAFFLDDDNSGADDEDFASGFDLTRAFIDFSGNVINPETIFKIRGEFGENYGADGDSDFGDFELQDAWAQHNFENGMSVRFGQFKAPVVYEEFYVDDIYQLAVDRSVTNEFFTPDYTQGVALSYRDDNFGGTISMNDGANTDNTPYFSASEADFSVTGRVDVLLAGGDWAAFNDFTSFRGNDTLDARIGGAIHWQTAGDTAAFGMGSGQVAVADADVLLYSIDASIEGNGWNLFGAFIGRSVDIDGTGGSGDTDFDDFGAVVQGGFFVADQWELFGRWDAIFFDDDSFTTASGGDVDDFHTLTAGFNYYFVPESHAAKLSADLQWFLNDADSGAAGISGIAPSQTTALLPSGGDDEIAIRLQMQLLF